MDIKVDLSDEYHIQFYENDDGNIVISGSVNCDCYDEEVLEVILKPEHVVKLLKEDWLTKLLVAVIDERVEKDKVAKKSGGTGHSFISDDLMKQFVMAHIQQRPVLDIIKANAANNDGKIRLPSRATPTASEDEKTQEE